MARQINTSLLQVGLDISGPQQLEAEFHKWMDQEAATAGAMMGAAAASLHQDSVQTRGETCGVSRHPARRDSRDLACSRGGLGCFRIPLGCWNLTRLLLGEGGGDPVGLGSSVRCSRADPMVETAIVVAAFLRIGSTASTITVSPSDSRGLLIWHAFGRGEHCVSSLVPPPANSGPLPFSGNSEFRAMEFFPPPCQQIDIC